MSKNYMTRIAVIVIIIIGIFFLKSIFFSSGSQTISNTNSNLQSVQLVNGVQEVTLSWGKFTYNPDTIIVKEGIPVRITGDLVRLTGCFRSLEIPAFGVSKLFTASSDTVEFTPDKIGTFPFSCFMGMGKGVIKVI